MEVVASAPGKVLITGGYLILERPNAGIVLSTNARFYAIVGPLYEEIKPESWAWAWADVKLTSPQLAREATYKLSLKDLTLQCVSSREFVNPFVEQAVQYAIAAAQTLHTDKDSKNTLRNILLKGIDITILGCNEFYSYRSQIEAHGLPLTPETLSKLPPFSSITFNPTGSTDKLCGNSCKPEVAKTGLGSSAALTTSVVAALLQYLKVIDLQLSSKCTVEDRTPYSGLDLVHVIAQCAHCIAQGKVGSGFDVSSAVFGSQRYVRFSSSVLSPTQIYGSRQVQNAVNEVMKENWDHERFQFSLPPLMELVLGEPGVGGSSTPSMVGAVKQWQKVAPEKSRETWKLLAKANSLVEDQFKALSRLAEEGMEVYKDTVIRCSLLNYSQWPKQATGEHQTAVVKSLLGVRDAFLQIRSSLKLMGEAAGVPIEPESQTRLLDSTMEIDGVVLAGVPGAGGFDAVFAITLCDAKQKVIQSWTSMGVLALLVREDPRGVSLETGDPRTPDFSPAISSVRIK